MATHSSILAWGQRSLVGYSPWGHEGLDNNNLVLMMVHRKIYWDWNFVQKIVT